MFYKGFEINNSKYGVYVTVKQDKYTPKYLCKDATISQVAYKEKNPDKNGFFDSVDDAKKVIDNYIFKFGKPDIEKIVRSI